MLNAASEVVETARGAVEFARRGEAPYVLILHGTPGGHSASFLGEPFEAAGFGTITPSRPGYLRTPIEAGRTFEKQADAVAALLDALSIDAVAVYAISGGGPSAIELAVSQLLKTESTSRTVMWIQGQLMRRLPRLAVSQLLKTESTLGAADRARVTAAIVSAPEKLAYLRGFVSNTPPLDLLRTGFDNDLEQFRAIERLPLGKVRCPTLVVHGTHDRDVPFSHGENSARGIPGAELHRVEKGWHLLALGDGADDYARAELAFLREHLVPQPPADRGSEALPVAADSSAR